MNDRDLASDEQSQEPNQANGIDDSESPPSSEIRWGRNAPKGGRTVLNRILKEGWKTPLFLGQSMAKSLRDVGYNSTTSAVCEHIDNALQWGADEIRVYFHQTGKRGNYHIDVLVADNGKGMEPNVLKVATAFGGSMAYDNRAGISRYGMGMKTAALSMGPAFDLISWQEKGAFYTMTLDVEEIASNRKNMIELPDPEFSSELPSRLVEILTSHMVYPKGEEDQELLETDEDQLVETLGESGTIVFVPDCDRLSYKQASSLVNDALKEFGRIYRRFIAGNKVRLYVNNRLVEPFDPTYWMPEARHNRLELENPRSSLQKSWTIEIPIEENSRQTAPVQVRLYALPVEEWRQLPRTTQKNALRLYDPFQVSYLRNDREMQIRPESKLGLSAHGDNRWIRLQIDFGGELDEAFGISANKQGVRPKQYVYDLVKVKIASDVASLRGHTREVRAKLSAATGHDSLSTAERKATDSDSLQGNPIPGGPETEDERIEMEKHLRELAMLCKRGKETEDQAFERVKRSNYLTLTHYDKWAPFYDCESRYGKVILKLNTAHPFYTKLYEPLESLANSSTDSDGSGEETVEIDQEMIGHSREAITSLQLLLFSLARTQSVMGTGDSENCRLFETLQKQWSDNFKVQLTE